MLDTEFQLGCKFASDFVHGVLAAELPLRIWSLTICFFLVRFLLLWLLLFCFVFKVLIFFGLLNLTMIILCLHFFFFIFLLSLLKPARGSFWQALDICQPSSLPVACCSFSSGSAARGIPGFFTPQLSESLPFSFRSSENLGYLLGSLYYSPVCPQILPSAV